MRFRIVAPFALAATVLLVEPRLAWSETLAEFNEQVAALKALARQDDPEAKFNLAKYLLYQRPVELGAHQKQDAEVIVGLLAAAADKGNEGATYEYGRILYTGWYGYGNWMIKPQLIKAETYLLQAAESGNGDAMAHLADIYIRREKLDLAFKWAVDGANLRSPAAMFVLAEIYRDPKFSKRDYSRAHELFAIAAKNGECEGFASLGLLFMDGRGVVADPAMARTLYDESLRCDQARPSAQVALDSRNLDTASDSSKSSIVQLGSKLAAAGSFDGPEGLTVAEALGGIVLLGLAAGLVLDPPGSSGPERNPPEGPWEAKYWCYVENSTTFGTGEIETITYCKDEQGWPSLTGTFSPCEGVVGWCEGGLLEQ